MGAATGAEPVVTSGAAAPPDEVRPHARSAAMRDFDRASAWMGTPTPWAPWDSEDDSSSRSDGSSAHEGARVAAGWPQSAGRGSRG